METRDGKNTQGLGNLWSDEQIKEQLRNEFVRPYIPGVPLILMIFTIPLFKEGLYFFTIIPLGLLYLFVAYEPTVKFCRHIMPRFKRNLLLYIGCLAGGFLLSFVTGSALLIFISTGSMLIFFIYFDRSWNELQRKWGVKEDEWFRKR